jgi:hypothetical protein
VFLKWTLACLVGLFTGLIATLINLAAHSSKEKTKAKKTQNVFEDNDDDDEDVCSDRCGLSIGDDGRCVRPRGSPPPCSGSSTRTRI